MVRILASHLLGHSGQRLTKGRISTKVRVQDKYQHIIIIVVVVVVAALSLLYFIIIVLIFSFLFLFSFRFSCWIIRMS